MQQLLLANPKSLHKRVMSHVYFYCCFCFCFLFLLPCCTRYYALLSSCLAIFEVPPCFSCIAPCYSHALHLVAFMLCTLLLSCLVALHCHALFLSHHTLLLSCLATPLCHALFFLHCVVLLLFLHFATLILMPCYLHHFVVHTLLPSLHLVVLPC
jgi:hypothetical protein